ncbi:MAG: acyl-CoA desaturase [Chloroflexi bacterium]|nr:acyl-CoA desaturase [Chloroflexota bacterium]
MSQPPASQTLPYAQLKRLVAAEGLLDAQPAYYWMKTTVSIGTLAAGIAIALVVSNTWLLLADAILLGFGSTQIALLAHEVGHKQGFRGARANAIARLVFGNLLLGISHTWWTTKHNQHHATPNHVDADPDIQFPMIVFSAGQIATRARLLRPIMAMQAFVFPMLLPFQALNMRWNSALHVLTGKSRRPLVEGLVLGVHYAAYGALLVFLGSWEIALAFAAVHHVVWGVYNSSVFASNHKGMPLIEADSRLDFFREQVLTSRNVRGHWWSDFWYGGLNYQIEHHLFPTMPRNNLSRAEGIVRAFCEKESVPYHSTGLLMAYREIFGHLHRVTASLRGGAAVRP